MLNTFLILSNKHCSGVSHLKVTFFLVRAVSRDASLAKSLMNWW